MAIYIDRDIGANLSGDLELDTKGDLLLAESIDSYKSAANFVLRTDFGDYAPDPQVGANLGSFVGKTNNRESHSHMEYNIHKSLKDEIFAQGDVVARVVPFDINEALCFIEIAGMYEVSGDIRSFDNERIVYVFPYIDGDPTPMVIT